MGKQENIDDWYQLAKDYAKAEKELKVDKWVEVTIYYGYAEKQVSLYRYNLPREMYFRYRWVIRWRLAKFQCKYPKQVVSTCLHFYDKRSGGSMEVGSSLAKLISAKAQVTKAERMMREYIQYNRHHNLFFDEETDEKLVKFKEKLERKKTNVTECEKRLKSLIERNKDK